MGGIPDFDGAIHSLLEDRAYITVGNRNESRVGNMTSCCLDLTMALREPPYPENCYCIQLFCLYMLVRITY